MRARVRSVWLAIVGVAALLVGGAAPGFTAAPPTASGASNARQEVPARLVRLTGDPAPGVKGEAARGRPDTAYVLVGGQRIPVALTLIRGVPTGAVLARLSAPVGGDDAAIGAALARGTVAVASVRVDPGERHGTDLGEHHVLVVPVYWESSTTDAGELARSFGAMADYYKRNTNAKITLATATIMAPQKITLTTTQRDECDYTAIESKVRTITGTTPHDRFHHIVAVMENLPSCWWGGLATLGPSATGDGFIWVNGYPLASLLAHEMGHNLDLTHSGALWCFDSRGKRVPLSDTCRSTTYDDAWDVMGNQPYGFGAIGAFNLDRLGVLGVGDRVVVPGSATVTLKPLEAGVGLRSVAFIDGNARYEIEYRIAAGDDRYIDAATYVDGSGVRRTRPGGGVIIRRYGLGWDNDDQEFDVVDFHPLATEETYDRHPGLEAGESFTWPGSRRAIRVESTSSAGAVITISRPHGDVVRWYGADRYSTSLTIAQNAFGGSGSDLFLASGNVFTDALSGAGVAGRAGSPLLLTPRDDLPIDMLQVVFDMKPPLATILGGPASVGTWAESLLEIHVAKVRRLAGADRYDASAAISQASFTPGVDVAYVASGLVFPDALSGAPVSGLRGGPMLLTRPDALPDAIASELRRVQPKSVVVLGGPASINDAVLGQIAAAAGVTPSRISGADRYEVSAAVSAANFPAGTDTVFIASGAIFTDALSGAPAAVVHKGPMLLVTSSRIPDAIRAELTRLKPRTIVILGGPHSVGSGVATALQAYLRS